MTPKYLHLCLGACAADIGHFITSDSSGDGGRPSLISAGQRLQDSLSPVAPRSWFVSWDSHVDFQF